MRCDNTNIPWLAISIGVATAVGVAFDQLAVCVGIGAGLGAALNAVYGRRMC